MSASEQLEWGAMNRLGKEAGTAPEALDMTGNIMAQILQSRPQIECYSLLPDGNIQFRLPLKLRNISAAQFSQARLMRTVWFANALGGFLIMSNIKTFESLALRDEWDDWCRHWQGGVGMKLSPRQLWFQVHASLITRAWNDQLRAEIRGVKV